MHSLFCSHDVEIYVLVIFMARSLFVSLLFCRRPSASTIMQGFGILELAGGLVPQGGLVKTARTGWKFIWLQMMRELAPQSPDGSYVR